MPRWTPADIADLSGRVAVVTGANSGLGFETAKVLADHGATVIAACRDDGRCSAAVERLHARAPSARVVPMRLDLADLDSVRIFAREFGRRFESLDILVNNAGVMAPPHRMTTTQGFELQFGVNHLGHFALTGLLMPALLRVPESRVVAVSSFAHESGHIDFENLQLERGYAPYRGYSASKLANLLFMLELDRRLRRIGARVLSEGAHPGFASTNLQATGPFLCARRLSSWAVLAAVRIFGQSAARGAEPQLYAATAQGVEGGDYYGPSLRAWGHAVPSSMAPAARDEESAARLWDVSSQLTGVDFDAILAADE